VASTEQDEHIEHKQECDEQQYQSRRFPPEGDTEAPLWPSIELATAETYRSSVVLRTIEGRR
jgi:hypothetical protein